MAAIASSGVPPSTMFRLLTGFEEYGEISKEAKKIVRNIDVFGQDITTALREVSNKTPSLPFKDFLEGVATTIDTGGNLQAFLRQQAEKALFEYRIRREKYLETLSTYADFYTAVLIAAPLFLVAILAVMNMIGGKLWGMEIETAMWLGISILMPIVNLVFLAFIHFTQPEL
jgi:flagellar protein FlaJ